MNEESIREYKKNEELSHVKLSSSFKEEFLNKIEKEKINNEELLKEINKETSCLTGENVKKSVITLCEKILEKKDNVPEISFMLDNSIDIPKKKKCC